MSYIQLFRCSSYLKYFFIAILTDISGIHYRVLNKAKGPAVWVCISFIIIMLKVNLIKLFIYISDQKLNIFHFDSLEVISILKTKSFPSETIQGGNRS